MPEIDTQTGEIVSGNAFGAVYLGRGKEPSMRVEDTDMVVRMTTGTSNGSALIRGEGKQAFGRSFLSISFLNRVRLTTRSIIDAACFHYSVRDPNPLLLFSTRFFALWSISRDSFKLTTQLVLDR